MSGGRVVGRRDDEVLIAVVVTNRVAFRSRLLELGLRVRVVGPPEAVEMVLAALRRVAQGTMLMAIFVDRVAELPRLLDALQYHPEGLRIDDLAVEVGRTPAQVREALLTYYTTDLALYDADLVGRPPAIEFVTGAGEDDDLGRASMVRLQAPEPGRELGVAYLSVTELARLYRAGRDRLELEPENETLRSAVNKLRAGLLPGVTPSVRGPLEPPPADFEVARRQRRRVAIVYARAWHPGDESG